MKPGVILCLLALFTAPAAETLQFPLTLQWAVEIDNERIATAAEPVIDNSALLVPLQSDRYVMLDPATGNLHPSFQSNYPMRPPRRPRLIADGKEYFTGEDLRLYCLDPRSRRIIWTSEQMSGQTAREYAPVLAQSRGKKFVVVRTNPILNMAQQISNDRNLLTRQAGIDASDWKKLDAWIKSDAATGTPELIAQEQDAIFQYLETNRWAQTFFVFNAETGKRAFTPPILWVGGCQGVGTPPAITDDGRAVVLYRSAYGNWNHGVAPLVTLGLLSFETGRIEPLRHNQGRQPLWNTFWGTADEAQNFTLAGDDLLIVHQGTLSRFNLKTKNLEKIWGERDTYGGFRNPPWARNEWHGPARGRVAVSQGRVYWITGSRLLCLGPEKRPTTPAVQTIKIPPASFSPRIHPQSLDDQIDEALRQTWAPLFVEPGLAGREFFFEESADKFIAFSWAYPHASKTNQTKIKSILAAEFSEHPPFTPVAFYSLTNGHRREPFAIPDFLLKRISNDKPAHPFGGLHSAWLYAERLNEWPRLLETFPKIRDSFSAFTRQNPIFGQKPELYFNRYLASLIALEKIAARANALEISAQAKALKDSALPTLLQWWKDAGSTLTTFESSKQLDPFIGKGDKLSFAIFPHRHKIALFHDLTPEIADLLRAQSPAAIDQVWKTFTTLHATWHLQNEERQVHYGENFIDPPDLAMSAFSALAFAKKAPSKDLTAHLDLPFCQADFYHIQKRAITLESQ